MQPGAVNGNHLQDQSVEARHLADQSVTAAHLAFAPVRSASRVPTVQQCGMTSFRIGEGETKVEVPVMLQEPYPSNQYVIVAMCNHPDFYAVLKTQREDTAFIEVVRRQNGAETFGFLSWIAVGSAPM
ncbi:hypothetical protein CM49_05297 [Paenibacillus sp. P1XP2]|nr:hypothetical protein CM49_05297 [Paenibacillus sp. P1XP2]